jgi:hypothetical protein
MLPELFIYSFFNYFAPKCLICFTCGLFTSAAYRLDYIASIDIVINE